MTKMTPPKATTQATKSKGELPRAARDMFGGSLTMLWATHSAAEVRALLIDALNFANDR